MILMRSDPVMVGASKFEREDFDAYFTIDPMCIEALCTSVRIPPGDILEPAAGRGHLVSELRMRNRSVVARDLVKHENPLVDDIAAGHNILDMKSLIGFGALITNLPYQTQDKLLEHILPIAARDKCMVAILTRAAWPIAQRRSDLVHHNKNFHGIVHLPRRPWWSEVRTSSPRHDFVWCIWDAEPRQSERATLYYPGVEVHA